MATDKLTDKAIRAAKPKSKDYKLADGGGMYLLVTQSGAKYWRLKYRFTGFENLLDKIIRNLQIIKRNLTTTRISDVSQQTFFSN